MVKVYILQIYVTAFTDLHGVSSLKRKERKRKKEIIP